MVQGACLCGACTISFTGNARVKALCHCTDCQKISGSMFSTNLFVDNDAVKLESGSPKEFSKPVDSGNTMTSFFCGDCGTTLWRESSGKPEIKFLKEGVLDAPSGTKPAVELFTHRRIEWVPDVPGAKQE